MRAAPGETGGGSASAMPAFVYPLLGALCGLVAIAAWHVSTARKHGSRLVASEETAAALPWQDEEGVGDGVADEDDVEDEDDHEDDEQAAFAADTFMGFKKGRL